jgi:hypothetical protein
MVLYATEKLIKATPLPKSPKSSASEPPIYYQTKEEAVFAISSVMRQMTSDNEREYGAHVYQTPFGYATGSIMKGSLMPDINPSDSNNRLGSGFAFLAGLSFNSVGFVHSHPANSVTDEFSKGDAFTAKLTGVCYLISPTSEYKLYGNDLNFWEDAWIPWQKLSVNVQEKQKGLWE